MRNPMPVTHAVRHLRLVTNTTLVDPNQPALFELPAAPANFETADLPTLVDQWRANASAFYETSRRVLDKAIASDIDGTNSETEVASLTAVALCDAILDLTSPIPVENDEPASAITKTESGFLVVSPAPFYAQLLERDAEVIPFRQGGKFRHLRLI